MSTRQSSASSSTRSKNSKSSKMVESGSSSVLNGTDTSGSSSGVAPGEAFRRLAQLRNNAGDTARREMGNLYISHPSVQEESETSVAESGSLDDSAFGSDLGKLILHRAKAAFDLPPPQLSDYKLAKSVMKDLKSAKTFVTPALRNSQDAVLESPAVDDMGLTPHVLARRQVRNRVSLGLITPAPLQPPPPPPPQDKSGNGRHTLNSPSLTKMRSSLGRPLSINSPKTMVSPRHAVAAAASHSNSRPSSNVAERSVHRPETLSLGLNSPRSPRYTTAPLNIETPVDRLSNTSIGSKRAVDFTSPNSVPYSLPKRLVQSAGPTSHRMSLKSAAKPHLSPIVDRPSTSKRSISEQADSQPFSGRKLSLASPASRQTLTNHREPRSFPSSYKSAVSSPSSNYLSVRSSSGQLNTGSIDGAWVDSRFTDDGKRKSEEENEGRTTTSNSRKSSSIKITGPIRPSSSNKTSLNSPQSPRGSPNKLMVNLKLSNQTASRISNALLSEDDEVEPMEESPPASDRPSFSTAQQGLVSGQQYSNDAMLSEEDDTEMGDHHESSPVPIHTRSSSTKQHFASSHRISSNALLSEEDEIDEPIKPCFARKSITRPPFIQGTPSRGPSRPSSAIKPTSQFKTNTPRASSTSYASLRSSHIKPPSQSASRRASSLLGILNRSNHELPISQIAAHVSHVLLSEEDEEVPPLGSPSNNKADNTHNRTFDKSNSDSQSPRTSTLPVVYNQSPSRVLSSVKSFPQPSQSPRASNLTMSYGNPNIGSPRRSSSQANIPPANSQRKNSSQTQVPSSNQKGSSQTIIHSGKKNDSQSPQTVSASAQTVSFNNSNRRSNTNEPAHSPKASGATVNFNSTHGGTGVPPSDRRSTSRVSQYTQTTQVSSTKAVVHDRGSWRESSRDSVRSSSSRRSALGQPVSVSSGRPSYGGGSSAGGSGPSRAPSGSRASSDVTITQRMSTYEPEIFSPIGLEEEEEKTSDAETLMDNSREGSQNDNGNQDDNDGGNGSGSGEGGSDAEKEEVEGDDEESGGVSVANISEDNVVVEAEEEPQRSSMPALKPSILDNLAIFPPRPAWFANRDLLMALVTKRMAGVKVTGTIEEKIKIVQEITSRAAHQVLYPDPSQTIENEKMLKGAKKCTAADLYYFGDKYGLMKNRTCPFEYFVLIRKLFFFPQILRQLVPMGFARAEVSVEDI